MGKIGVLGSLNVDLTVTMERFHQPGETITGSDFRTFTGGKGGNQAVAAAKLGNAVTMAGKLGEDENARLYRETMRTLNIRQDTVWTQKGVPSGVALIEVDQRGENRIVVVPGSNAWVDCAQVDALAAELTKCDIVMMQLEIPLETVRYAAQKLKELNVPVMLDPAPAIALGDELLAYVDYLTPNETELQILSGMPTKTDEQVRAAAESLLRKGARCVIAKLGGRGAMLVTPREALIVPGFSVKAVDTTAAGDSFNAGLATALTQKMSIAQAVRFANAVGALATTGMGAQQAMPTMEQTLLLMQEA